MNTVWAALVIAGKDLRAYFRDRTGMALGFLLPIALVTVFGFVMNVAFQGSGGMPKAELWVADEDKTDESRKLIEQLRKMEMLDVQPAADEPPKSGAEVRTRIRDGEAHHALVIEPGYGDAVKAGTLPNLTLVRDPGREMEDRIARIGLTQAILASTEGQLMPATMGKMFRDQGMDEKQVQEIMGAAGVMQRLMSRLFEEEEKKDEDKGGAGGANPGANQNPPSAAGGAKAADEGANVDFFQAMAPVASEDIQPPTRPKMLTYFLAQSVCGTIVMMLMFGLTACSSMLLYERESGTMKRLLAAAIPRNSIVLGKFIFAVVMGVIQLTVLLVYGNVLFKLEAFRDLPTLAVISVSWVAAATSFGMLIAAWARTAKQAEGLSTILILVMAALGGCWFPIQTAKLPWYADAATHSMPTYWAMTAYQQLFWQQKSLASPTILTALAVLWVFSFLASGLAMFFFRRRYLAG
ncbi:MAG: ABC transporter permease [Planctomycetia bacterium]|nr:ABC transporter permease [Planctomycetia bacterium]